MPERAKTIPTVETRTRKAGPSLRLRRRTRVALAWFLSWLIAVQPTLVHAADIAADAAAADANRPRIDTAANGIVVVDIVAPNGAGLSHNKYSRFSVDAAGAVLNNSDASVAQSQLGGLLQGNANLAGSGTARVILNEVTGTGRSQLAGALEVHGTAADVVVANPNGIACDGCRFINTPRATLSTGAPELGGGGGLAALRVEGGDILVGARGAAMDATAVFDLVARRIVVEGPVNAGGALNLVAGRNRYDYAAGLASALAPDGEEPGIAIDSTLLGGMYAGRIAIVSNDRGAGVRMHGQMAASAGNMTLSADGNLVLRKATAAGTVEARSAAGAIEVADTLHGAAGVALDAANGVANTGDIGSGADLSVSLGGDLANDGSIVSAGATTLAGRNGGSMGYLDNRAAGVVNGGGGLTVRATDLTNDGALGSAGGAVAIDLTGTFVNRGLVYSATSAHFRLDGSFANRNADIVAGTDLTVEGLSGARAGDFVNSSGTIEAVAGNLTLKAASVANRKRAFAVEETETSETVTSPGWGVERQTATRTTTTITTKSIVEDSPASRLLAGGNIAIETGTFANEHSQVAAAADLAIAADSATNTGDDIIETTVVKTRTQRWEKKCHWSIFGGCGNVDWDPVYTTETETTTETLAAVYGTIEAGGTLSATVTGYLHNDAVRGGQTGLWSGTGPEQLADLIRATLSPDALDVGLDALARRAALFDTDPAPDAPYLVETRPEFVDSSLYLGSDYFLERAGIVEPDATMKRFGDAHVETRLVEEQVFRLTGARYLAGFTDARAQMRRLYDNAIDAQVALDLTIGVALTPDQIAALNAEILWLEYRTVRGQRVLVPRLYLAAATVAGIDLAGARIHGGRIALAAGMLANSGRIEGRERLDIETADALVNRGGALASQGDVEIDAGALFANISGTVSGNGVRITAGDIEHATAVVRDRYGKNFADRAQQTARIAARGNLALEATGSISATGSDIAAGGNAVLRAGGDIGIRALAVEKRFKDIFREGYNLAAALTHRRATLKAGGNLTVDAGRDLTLHGAQAEAGADAQLAAGGSVTVASVQDRRQKDFKYDFKGSGPLGAETNIREQRATVETKRSTVSAGGTLTVRAGTGDVTLDAATLKSGGETVLDAAEGKVALRTETDSDFKRDYKRTEDLVWWKERDKGHYKEEIEHVEIEAGGGLKIIAGAGLVVEYRKAGSLDASLDRLARSPGLEWIGQLRGNPDIDWIAVEAAFDAWDYKAEGLTQAGAALVSLVTAAVTAGTLSSVSAMLAKGLGFAGAGSMQAAFQAGLTSLASQASVALVNNKGDLGAALRQLGSSLTLKSLATAMVAAGLGAELTQLAGLDKALPKNAVFADRVARSLQRNLLRSTVQAGVATAIQGGKLDDALVRGLSDGAISAALSGVQHEIGSFGVKHGLPEGSIRKILAHALAGGLASELAGGAFADGAMAAALAEAAGPLLGDSGLGEETQIALQRLVGAAAILLRGSDVGEAMFAGNVAASAHRNNYLSHDEAVERARSRKELDKCRAAPGTCSHAHMAQLQGAIALLDGLDESRDLALQQACTSRGQAMCAVYLQRAYSTLSTFQTLNKRFSSPEEYKASIGEDIFEEIFKEYLSDKALYNKTFKAATLKGTALAMSYLKAFGTGAAGGAAAATAVFGGKTIAACIANPICRVEVGTAVAEAAAGDALGGASLLPVVVGGKVAVMNGDEVLGFIDEATGSFKRAADAAYDANAVREAAAAIREARRLQREPAQITINREQGIEFERQVVDALGHVGAGKNTMAHTVPLGDGTRVTTVPDLWGRNVGGVLEAKNVQKLSLSNQLRAQIKLARENNQPFNLVVSPRTRTVSEPLRDAVKKTRGHIYVYNPATKDLTEFKFKDK